MNSRTGNALFIILREEDVCGDGVGRKAAGRQLREKSFISSVLFFHPEFPAGASL